MWGLTKWTLSADLSIESPQMHNSSPKGHCCLRCDFIVSPLSPTVIFAVHPRSWFGHLISNPAICLRANAEGWILSPRVCSLHPGHMKWRNDSFSLQSVPFFLFVSDSVCDEVSIHVVKQSWHAIKPQQEVSCGSNGKSSPEQKIRSLTALPSRITYKRYKLGIHRLIDLNADMGQFLGRAWASWRQMEFYNHCPHW